jgi:hypothetical protein
VSRANWRVLLTWHIAESREQARREAGLTDAWHNEHNVRTPAARCSRSPPPRTPSKDRRRRGRRPATARRMTSQNSRTRCRFPRRRHHHRLRARLGQSGKHPPQQHGGALRGAGNQRLYRWLASRRNS